jgi:hypothetical protein
MANQALMDLYKGNPTGPEMTLGMGPVIDAITTPQNVTPDQCGRVKSNPGAMKELDGDSERGNGLNVW